MIRMTIRALSLTTVAGLGWALTLTAASGDERPTSAEQEKKTAPSSRAEAFVKRLMAFDKNKDGKLVKDEIIDERLLPLFTRADANKDGAVTRAELLALAGKELADGEGGGPFGKGGRFGKGGKGDRGRFGKGGPGGRFGEGPRPMPGQVLPPFVREVLDLTPEQVKELAKLQKDVDARLGKILTDEQKKRLKEMRDRGMGKGPFEGRKGGRGEKDREGRKRKGREGD